MAASSSSGKKRPAGGLQRSVILGYVQSKYRVADAAHCCDGGLELQVHFTNAGTRSKRKNKRDEHSSLCMLQRAGETCRLRRWASAAKSGCWTRLLLLTMMCEGRVQ